MRAWLRERDPGPVVYLGASLGAAVATALAAEDPPAAPRPRGAVRLRAGHGQRHRAGRRLALPHALRHPGHDRPRDGAPPRAPRRRRRGGPAPAGARGLRRRGRAQGLRHDPGRPPQRRPRGRRRDATGRRGPRSSRPTSRGGDARPGARYWTRTTASAGRRARRSRSAASRYSGSFDSSVTRTLYSGIRELRVRAAQEIREAPQHGVQVLGERPLPHPEEDDPQEIGALAEPLLDRVELAAEDLGHAREHVDVARPPPPGRSGGPRPGAGRPPAPPPS